MWQVCDSENRYCLPRRINDAHPLVSDDMLQNHCRLADTPWTDNSNQATVPVDALKHVSAEICGRVFQQFFHV
jgi:hypothetical protein